MNDTIRVLMKRDNLSEAEATEIFNECKEAILESDMQESSVEEILAGYLGLEMDYIWDFIPSIIVGY